MKNRADEYNDDAELTEYVWHNYRHLLTQVEGRASRVLLAEQKAQYSDEPMATELRKRWGVKNDIRITELLKNGPDAFRKQCRDRILKNAAYEIFINRCPCCQRIVATPKAQQCLWCGHDWHQK